MMAGPPLRLNIDPEVTPVVAHKAASVPVHWEGKVKEHLDRDVRLGVIAPSEPLTLGARG